MDYQVPDLCIQEVYPGDELGKVWLTMPSIYDPSPQPPSLVSQETLDWIKEKYNVPLCPPNWPEGHPDWERSQRHM